MTAILMPSWQGPGPVSDSQDTDRRKPSLRVIPVQSAAANELPPSPGKLTSGLFTPRTYLAPVSPSSPKSPGLKQKMHSRMRSIGGKTPMTAVKKWERLSEKDKATSEKFVKDAVSMCGLAGFSWKKTYEYLRLAAELPLHPDYILNPDEPLLPDDDASSRSSSRRPSTSLLTPVSAPRPGSATPSTLSVSSSLDSVPIDTKTILTRIRLLFEDMQKVRDPLYIYYVNLPQNNLKKMHAHAVSQHRAAVLRQERSSLMDAIDFDKQAERSRGMELAVAKLRFEMELDIEASLDADEASVSNGVLMDVKQAEARDRRAYGVDASIKHSNSILSFASGRTSNMRRESSNNHRNNNRVSGVPTIVTTVSDMIPSHMRHDSIASSIERPASPASARSDVPVQSRDFWKRLHRRAKRSPSRVDGVSRPGEAQKTDANGYFSPRP